MKISLISRSLLCIISLVFSSNVTSIAQRINNWSAKSCPIPTKWASNLNISQPLPEYPRPQMVRTKNWQNLNGLWEYSVLNKDEPMPSTFQGTILVPFPIESSLSGVKKTLSQNECLWYRKEIITTTKDKKSLLHFGAVDWEATVFVNGNVVGTHRGGFTEFTIDITDFLKIGKNELIVKAYDPTDFGVGPHGKQSLNPGNIYYTPSSGIWQTVWLEEVPLHYIKTVNTKTDIDNRIVDILIDFPDGCTISAEALEKGNVVARQTGSGRSLVLKIPNPKLWSPESPFLYDLKIKLFRGGKSIDSVQSYFGMRKISIAEDKNGITRILLNNKYYFNLGVLDQGYWPDGLYTSPSDSALIFDISLIKMMGFNTIRKHIKVEPSRWYYYADKLGILVWQDFVNPNQRLPEGSKRAFEDQNEEIISQLYSHPSITTWVLFNEKWGQYDQERLTRWVKKRDPSRLVNGHSGEFLYVDNILRSPSSDPYIESDITDVHSYPWPMLSKKMLKKVQVCGEFGGIGVAVEGHVWDDIIAGWGYDGLNSTQQLEEKYGKFIDSLRVLELKGLSGSIYTQIFDVEGELNGLATYDRKYLKMPLKLIYNLNQKVLNHPTNYNLLSVDKMMVFNSSNTNLDDIIKSNNYSKLDSTTLRKILIYANIKGDNNLASIVVPFYQSSISDPMNDQNLKLILQLTNSISAPAFSWLYINHISIDSVLSSQLASGKLKYILYNEYIKPYQNLNNLSTKWDSVFTRIPKQYMALGEQIFYRSQAIYSINKKDWRNFIKCIHFLFDHGYDEFSQDELNDFSWEIFENVSDSDVLKSTLPIIKKAIEKGKNATVYDTYANILYKLGNRDTAIQIQTEALNLPVGNGNFDDVKSSYNKMINNIPTWK